MRTHPNEGANTVHSRKAGSGFRRASAAFGQNEGDFLVGTRTGAWSLLTFWDFPARHARGAYCLIPPGRTPDVWPLAILAKRTKRKDTGSWPWPNTNSTRTTSIMSWRRVPAQAWGAHFRAVAPGSLRTCVLPSPPIASSASFLLPRS